MPSVYDKEKDDTSYGPDGSHDDLGVHPERREAEMADLENAYDAPSADDSAQPLSGSELADREEEATSSKKSSLNDQVRDKYKNLRDQDEAAGFFKPESDKKGLRGRLRNMGKKKALAAGGALGFGLIGLIFGIFGYLNTFRIDHILSSLDQQTFSRFNASFERRTDAWFQSYVRLRLAEVNGEVNTDENPVFRANRVDTDNPARDWYRTMRTSSFEANLLKKGIRFESTPVDGGFTLTVLKIDDRTVLEPLTAAQIRRGEVERLINSGEFDGKISSFFDGPAESDKVARRQIKQVVNENTKARQVFRRRHLRQDIANMTGVREWRLFERTRDKIDDAKIGMQRKIINKVFSGDASSTRFINCLLGGGGCPNTTDANDPENRATATPSGVIPEGEQGEGHTVNPDGSNARDGNNAPIRGISDDEIVSETAQAATDAVQNTPEGFTPSQAFTKNVVDRLTSLIGRGGNVWEWAKKIAAIHALFTVSSSEGRSKIEKLVYNARTTQLQGFYTAVGIGRDQIKSGELVSDELNGYYDMTRNMGNSEAWAAVSSSASGTASAQGTTNVGKDEYCRSDHVKTFDEYSWHCDSFKPNGGSTAGDFTKAYNTSIGYLFAPIAEAVNGVNRIPVVSNVINAFGTALGSITSIFGQAGLEIMRGLGLADNVEALIGSGVAWVTQFAGAGPFIDPAQSGFSAWLLGGSASVAETTTRASGGVLADSTTYKYSSELAAEFEAEQVAGMSWSERYMSLENPKSMSASLAFSASNVLSGENMVSKFFGAVRSAPQSVFASITQPAYAAVNKDLAAQAGVDKYDIPRECLELDPLDSEYLTKATNASIPDRSFAIINDKDAFWQAVYENDQPVSREKIYNCATLDQRARSGLGYVNGYTDDDGYGDGSSVAGPVAPESTAPPALGNTAATPCAAGTTDLGEVDGYKDKQKMRIRLCGINGFLSNGGEDAQRIVRVNSVVSDKWNSLYQKAKANNINLVAKSSFRSMEQQTYLWGCYQSRSCNGGNVAAEPGTSNHQMGIAVDIDIAPGTDPSLAACQSNPSRYPTYQWLADIAPKLGIEATVKSECWHWANKDG